MLSSTVPVKTFRDFNYLGEWHFHPSFSVRPSPEDVATMTELVEDERIPISFAVLLVSSAYVSACGWSVSAGEKIPH